MRDQRKKILFAAVIIILGFGVYANVITGKFVWDDEILVKNNTYIRSWSNLPKVFSSEIGGGAGYKYFYYRPLLISSYLVDYALGKTGPVVYHFTNILLHVLTALAVFWLIALIINDWDSAFVAALFFTIHPVQTEAVSYIAGRADLLALLFMLAGIISYGKYLAHLKPQLNLSRFYWITVSCFILAIFSKESAVIFPVLLVLFHWFKRIPVRLKYFLPIAAVMAVYFIARGFVIGPAFVTGQLSGGMDRAPGFFAAMSSYMRLLIAPYPLHMEYGNQLFSWSDIRVISGAAITGVLVWCGWFFRNRSRAISFSVAWFFITLLPAANIYLTAVYMAEHYLYAPSLGFFLAMTAAVKNIRTDQVKKALTGLGIVCLAVYCGLTMRQNIFWREPTALYERILHYNPDSARVCNLLGKEYFNQGRIDESIKMLSRAISLNPAHDNSRYNLGIVYSRIGKYQEAQSAFLDTIAINPRHFSAYTNLGNVYKARKENDKAIKMYYKAIEINPGHASAYYNLGRAFYEDGDYAQAVPAFKKVLELEPENAGAHNDLAVAYYKSGQYDSAVSHCDKALGLGYAVHPDFLKALEPFRKTQAQ